ncbi:MAG: hypothetical protein NC918_00300 [Candidatus Omnitrophica bacterium]|nr:hypothetical protein [Candidatus Omnitrophota bacterium]
MEIFNKIRFDFFPLNSQLQKNKNQVWFGFKELLPNQTQIIEYKVNSLVDNPELYLKWRISNLLFYKGTKIDIYSPMKKVYLKEVFIPTFLPGEKKILKFDVLNNYYLKKEIKINLITPSGWSSSKQFVNFILEPRGLQRIEFMLSAPENISAGKYLGLLLLEHDGESEEKEINLEVKSSAPHILVTIKEPFEIKFVELKNTLLDNKDLIIFSLVLILTSTLFYLLKRKELEQKVQAQSINELHKIKEILSKNKNSNSKI